MSSVAPPATECATVTLRVLAAVESSAAVPETGAAGRSATPVMPPRPVVGSAARFTPRVPQTIWALVAFSFASQNSRFQTRRFAEEPNASDVSPQSVVAEHGLASHDGHIALQNAIRIHPGLLRQLATKQPRRAHDKSMDMRRSLSGRILNALLRHKSLLHQLEAAIA